MLRIHSSFIKGSKTITPVLLGVIPFAMISGITAINTNLPPAIALFMSITIFAGASQLAVLQLFHQNAAAAVIIYTALIINFRFMIYSLSIAPYFRNEPVSWKMFLSYMMTDQSYALSMVHFMNEPDDNPKWFFFGASALLWVVWQAATLIGLILGAIIPPQLGLDFAIPLTFTAVLFKSSLDKPTVITVVVSATAAVATANIPMNAGLPLAALAGISAGVLTEIFINTKEKRSESVK